MNKDRTHTAYFENFRELERENGGPGKCPSTHPIKYPRIFLEIYYTNSDPALPWAEGVDHGGQPYVLANGDATGVSLRSCLQGLYVRQSLQELNYPVRPSLACTLVSLGRQVVLAVTLI